MEFRRVWSRVSPTARRRQRHWLGAAKPNGKSPLLPFKAPSERASVSITRLNSSTGDAVRLVFFQSSVRATNSFDHKACEQMNLADEHSETVCASPRKWSFSQRFATTRFTDVETSTPSRFR